MGPPFNQPVKAGMVSQIRGARDGAIRIEDIKPIGRVHLSGRVRR